MDNDKKLDEMIMELFALKGKTGYTAFDVAAWRKHLRRFSLPDIARAFQSAIQKEGFFEIKHILDELQPNDKAIAVEEWDKCIRVAMDGGQGFDRLSDSTQRALKLAGGLQKLRLTESEYTKNNMRQIFIDTFDTSKKQIALQGGTYKFIEELAERKKLK